MTKPLTPDERLTDLADLFRTRNAAYGNSYMEFGKVLAGFFPDGIQLNGVDDFNRFALFMMITGKLHRYAMRFADHGQPDSLDDASVYAQMLNHLDSVIAERGS